MNDSVLQAWADRDGPAIFTTIGSDGTPNAIYATCVGAFGTDRLVVADNYFDKTRRNLLDGGKKGCLLFRTKAGKAFQVKGTVEYHTEGEVFEQMKTWNPPQHPGHGAGALCVEEVYSGAVKVC